MKLSWPFRRRDDGITIREYPRLETVSDAVAESCIANLQRRVDELEAEVRSLISACGNRTKIIHKYDPDWRPRQSKARLKAAGMQ